MKCSLICAKIGSQVLLRVEFLEQVGALTQGDFGNAFELFHIGIEFFDGGVAIGGGFGSAADGRVLIGVGFGVGVERGQSGGDGGRREAVGGQRGGIGRLLGGLVRGARQGDEFLLVGGQRAADFEGGAIGGAEGRDGADGLAEVNDHFAGRGGMARHAGGGMSLRGQGELALGEGGLSDLVQPAAFGEFGGVIATGGQRGGDFGIAFDGVHLRLRGGGDLVCDQLVLLGVALDGLGGRNHRVGHDAPLMKDGFNRPGVRGWRTHGRKLTGVPRPIVLSDLFRLVSICFTPLRDCF